MDGHAANESFHGRPGLEAVTEGGSLRIAPHFATVARHCLRCDLLRFGPRHGEAVEDDHLGRLHRLRGMASYFADAKFRASSSVTDITCVGSNP